MCSSAEDSSTTWCITENRFVRGHQRYYETVFSLANGYLGTRGTLEEQVEGSQPVTLLAGVFDDAPERGVELGNVASGLALRLSIGAAGIGRALGEVVEHQRTLDMRQGVLRRRTSYALPHGETLQLRGERIVSAANRHSIGMNLRLELLPPSRDDDATPRAMVLDVGFDDSATNDGIPHFVTVEKGSGEPGHIFIVQRTKASGIIVAQAAYVQVSCHNPDSSTTAIHLRQGQAPSLLEFEMRPGAEYSIEKIVTVFTSRDSADPKEEALQLLAHQRKKGFAQLLKEHCDVWKARWATSDIRIEGDEIAQRAVRFSIFHLLQAAPAADERVSIPAKALTGLGYRGHVFWDTEIFMMPFLTLTNPDLSRNMLMYRYHTLPGARKKAAQNGYAGAMFAWESADTGEETTPKWGTHPKEDKPTRIWTGDREQHISADVAYAIWMYVLATGDETFLARYGAEIIFETARFWVSRLEYVAQRDRYELTEVIGPDEYHENVNNNAFTNVLAQWNIRKAAELVTYLQSSHPREWEDVSRRLDLREPEYGRWVEVAGKVYIPFDARTMLFSQFDGFFDLESIDLSTYADRTKPIDVVLTPGRIKASRVSKQADVLMLLFMFPQDYTRDVKAANWGLYEPLCAHGSSLSPAIHSIVASDLGHTERAYEHFIKAAAIDLEDKMGNTVDGIHAATAGGILQAVIFGFGGVRLQQDGFLLNPRLPAHWKSLSFTLAWRGQRVEVTVPGTRRHP